MFYDKNLSLDGTVSCGSCHHQSAGFSDPGKGFSTGVEGKSGLRHAPALANLAWYPAFMADGGINHIEVMPIAPLQDSLEMANTMAEIIDYLQHNELYQDMFQEAFGRDQVTSVHMLRALAQFMSMMISDNSKFDQYLRGEESFSAEEQKGYALFQLHCSGCHNGALLTDFSYRNNGLDVYSNDEGRARITQLPGDHGKFKVPGLRNIAVSAPYMHDGRFNTLEEVLDHYIKGIQPAENLDPILETPIVLSKEEKNQLLAFLEALTDYTYLNKPELSALAE